MKPEVLFRLNQQLQIYPQQTGLNDNFITSKGKFKHELSRMGSELTLMDQCLEPGDIVNEHNY